MASAAEQLVANLNFSAFAKAEELKAFVHQFLNNVKAA